MKPKEIKYILENIEKESPEKIASSLGLKERTVRRFIKSQQQSSALAGHASNKNPADRLNYFYFKLFAIILISTLGIIIYSNAFHCSFQFDDEPYIVKNSFIRDIQNLQNIWQSYPCRFVTILSFAFNYYFHQLDVFGYHLFSVAVHLVSAILVWWLTLLTLSTPAMKENRITQHANIIALFVGLIFVSHPVQVESVTYIWQRAASMAALFYLASLSFYVKSRLLQNKGSRFYYILSLAIAVVAMFTKENTITLPLMILFYEFSFFGVKTLNWKRIFPFLLTIIIIPLTILFTELNRVQEIQGIAEGPGGISPIHYLLTQFRVMATYIRLIFLPFNLNLDYDYPIFKSIFELQVLTSFLFLIGILALAKQLFLKYRLVSFSIIWFFLTLLPESSLLPEKDVIFEHRLYLPLVGYSLFLVSAVYYFLGKNPIKMMMIALTMMIVCNSVLTYQRNKVWKDGLTLWNDAVGKSPYKARPYNNRGRAYDDQGNFTQAVSDYNKAIGIDPQYADAYYNRGMIYYNRGSMTQAISDFTKTIEIDQRATAYNSRGNVYYKQNNLTQAMSDYNRAIEINPQYAEAYNDRGVIDGERKNFKQAVSDFTKAIDIDPKYTSAYNNRALTIHLLERQKK
jgi:tetratricopeptide (TPR) repeat protein